MAQRALLNPLTIEEFIALPEMKPYPELVGGEIYQKEAPSGLHQLIELRLVRLFQSHPATQGGVAMTELTTVFDDLADPRVLVPDFSFYVDASRFSLAEQREPPDLAVEIRSRGQSVASLREKAAYYLAHGVRAAWIVDPFEEQVEVWGAGATPQLATGADRIGVGEFAVEASDVFEVGISGE